MLNFHNLHSNMIMKAFSHEDTNNDYKKDEADNYNHETERLAEDNKEPDIVRSFPRISLLSLLFIECIIIVLHPIIIPMRRPHFPSVQEEGPWQPELEISGILLDTLFC